MSSRGFIELLSISQRGNAASRLRQADSQGQWSGVACRVGIHHMVVPMGEVSEVVNMPPVTTVPQVKPWFKGVGNLRGRLICVCSTAEFLQIESRADLKPKILVIDHQDNLYGFEVDHVYGITHFEPHKFHGASVAQGDLSGVLRGFFEDTQKNIAWHVLPLSNLVQKQEFQSASGKVV